MNLVEALKEVTTPIERQMMYNFTLAKCVKIVYEEGKFKLFNFFHTGWYCYGAYETVREAVDKFLKIIDKHIKEGNYAKTYQSAIGNLEMIIE